MSDPYKKNGRAALIPPHHQGTTGDWIRISTTLKERQEEYDKLTLLQRKFQINEAHRRKRYDDSDGHI